MASLPARGVTGIPEEVLRKVFLSRGKPAPCCFLPPPAPHFLFIHLPCFFIFFWVREGGASTLAPSKVAFVRVCARHSPSCTTNHRALMQIVYRLQPFPIAPAFLILGGAHKAQRSHFHIVVVSLLCLASRQHPHNCNRLLRPDAPIRHLTIPPRAVPNGVRMLFN